MQFTFLVWLILPDCSHVISRPLLYEQILLNTNQTTMINFKIVFKKFIFLIKNFIIFFLSFSFFSWDNGVFQCSHSCLCMWVFWINFGAFGSLYFFCFLFCFLSRTILYLNNCNMPSSQMFPPQFPSYLVVNTYSMIYRSMDLLNSSFHYSPLHEWYMMIWCHYIIDACMPSMIYSLHTHIYNMHVHIMHAFMHGHV